MLPRPVQEQLNLLYKTDEYGAKFVDLTKKPSVELVKFFEQNYHIKTDRMAMCVGCQIRQIAKYMDARIDSSKYPTDKFNIRCTGVPANIPVSEEQVKRIATEKGIAPEDARRHILATIDPVAWAEMMFGFRESTPEWALRPYQREQLRCNALRAVHRQGRRSGKALALDTPIPTPIGWTNMGSLKEGDQVFDEQGKPCNVTFVTEIMHDHDCYEVEFNDGSVIVADAEHQWTVETKSIRKNRARYPHLNYPLRTLTTAQMIAEGVKVGSQEESNFSIPLTKPLEYPENTFVLPVDPYLLGCWLGDGVTNTGRITIGMEDIQEAQANIEATGYKMRVNGFDPIDRNVYGLIYDLRAAGVADHKHIPQEYLMASAEDRMELLKGLMDTDGSIDAAGHCEFSSSIPELANQVYELITGLGFKASLNWSESWLNGVRHKDRGRIYFVPDRNVFKLTRKANRIRTVLESTQGRRFIVAIRPTTSVPVRCITVDSPNHLYLAGKACIPTHNTFLMALKLLYLCFNLTISKGFDADGNRIMDGPEVIIVTPFQSQISNIFQEMEKLLKRNKSLGAQVEKNNKGNYYTQTPFFSMNFANGANISGFVTGTAHKQDGSAGGTIRGDSADVIYLDEMDLIPDEILKKVIEPLLMTRTGVRMFGTSTPIGKRATFYKWTQERPDFKEFYYPSTSLPAWEEVKNEIVGDAAEGNETFRAEYLAEFVDGSYGVFKASNIHAARANYTYEQVGVDAWYREVGIRNRADLVTCIGIDWNKNSGSEFVVVGYDPESSNWFALDAVNITAAHYTFEAYKEEFLRLNFKWKPDYIYADAGYGHTVIEDLKLIAHRLKGKPHLTGYESETIKVLDRLKAFEFGGKVELRDPVNGQSIAKPGKAFLVETAVRLFEANKFFFPEADAVLTKQLGNYVVLRQSESTGKPIYGPDNEKIGDHRLDAMMLAIGGIFLEQGIYARKLAGSTPAMLSKENDELPGFLFNERTDGMVLKDDISKRNGTAGAYLSVLEVLRGNNREQDQNVRKGYAAQEYLKKPDRTRGTIGTPPPPPQAPASAYAKDEEDVWRAQRAWQAQKEQGGRGRGFTRRGGR